MAPQTLLLCFIHGFKGNDDTFHDFPVYLSEKVVSEVKEKDVKLEVKVAVYPKYETRGDLPGCVEAFRAWLLQEVFALEKEAGNTAPRLKPSVGVILVSHSMGGLVTADTLFTFLDSIPKPTSEDTETTPQPLFPLIQGLLAFDTPYSGLSRSMFAYGAFAQYKSVTGAYGLVASLSAPIASYAGASSAAAVNPALAVAALGAVAYANRERIGQLVSKEDISRGISAVNVDNMKSILNGVSRENIEQGLSYVGRQNLGNGFAWLSSHLQFVSALMRGQELKSRLERLSSMRGIGFADLYTSMGKNETWNGGYFVSERTFCAVPKETTKPARYFIKEVNTQAKDETDAHMAMFRKEKNPGYEEMAKHAAGLVSSWALNHNGHVVDSWQGPEDATKVKATTTAEGAEKPASNSTIYTYSEAAGLKEVPASSQDVHTTPQQTSWYSSDRYKQLSSYLPTLPTRSKPKASSERTQTLSPKAEKDGEGEEVTEQLEMVPLSSSGEAEAEKEADGDEVESEGDGKGVERTRMLLRRTESSASIPGVTEDLEFF